MERRERAGTPQNITPRLRPGEVFPTVEPGMQVVRVYGELKQIPAANVGDEQYGLTGFTKPQVVALEGIIKTRRSEQADSEAQRESFRGEYY